MIIAKLLLTFAKTELRLFTQFSKLLKTNPKKLMMTLKRAPQEFIDKIGELPAKAIKDFEGAFMSLFDDPTKVSEFLARISPEDRKTITEAQNMFSSEEREENVKLSSSWQRSATYIPGGLSGGELLLKTKKSSKTYAFPGLPRSVWEAMKAAKGSNGGGSGTIFWAFYYRNYRGTTTARQLRTLAKLTGRSKGNKRRRR